MKKIGLAILLLLGLVPSLAIAQVTPLSGATCGALGINCNAGQQPGDLGNYLLTIVNAALALVAVVAAAFVIYGGIKYITSGGDEDEAKTGKKTILYAVIGLIIIGLAFVIVNFTLSVLGIGASLPGSADLPGAVWLIINGFLVLASIVAAAFIIYGGLKYITAAGDEDQAATGKRTVLYAVVGLLIIGLSVVIVNFTTFILGGTGNLAAFQGTLSGSNLVASIWYIINGFLILASIVAVAFIIYSGIRYITSAGDTDKAEEAKRGILYAVVGLVIIGLSVVVVNFTMLILGGNSNLPAFQGTFGGSNLLGAVQFLINAFLVLVALAALVFIILAGVQYITSRGDEDQAQQAKRTILYAIIGLLVIGLAAAIVNFVIAAIDGTIISGT